ncbi:MAG TPA: adenylyltransferase/cytidyltransferase family protein [Candidatus Sumerlaeota bacterium]|nr:MAG: Bifunctional protein HldE [candidate division BRC1 bacterium ADurb.BinA292]HOR26650.1 adenylyltransferase/cytidyltransferase family protein [Candidatus Sumerlaeota bacterium]HPK01488.1 adenylyltransferase/cytidyltransferase family protein [Candidatus Sumerlaeota bacterium]
MTPPLPASPRERIVDLAEAAEFARDRQRRGLRVVFANGCFDVLHAGHVSYLNDARQEGDALIVGINSDRSVREIKGPDRPIVPQEDRAELIAAMEAVDRVVIFDEPTAERCLRTIRPDVHAKGTDYTAETVPEREIARELGIRVAISGAPKTNASKQILRAVREQQTP